MGNPGNVHSVPERPGERGPVFRYPEWLIMFISVLSVKLKISTYTGIHKMMLQDRDVIAEGSDLKPVSERQSRDRLEKISHYPGKPAAFIFQFFPETDRTEHFQRGKMMNSARGPLWHKKYKDQCIIPK